MISDIRFLPMTLEVLATMLKTEPQMVVMTRFLDLSIIQTLSTTKDLR